MAWRLVVTASLAAFGGLADAAFQQNSLELDAAAALASEDECTNGVAEGECALSALQHRRAVLSQTPLPGAPAPGKALAKELVQEVWTFGAPATHKTPFFNKARADGCFGGLRCYTEDLKGVRHEIKQIDAAAINNFYPHARTNTVVLRYGFDSIYAPCNAQDGGHPEWPQRGGNVFEEWRLHQEDDYQSRLTTVKINGKDMSGDDMFKKAYMYSVFAWRSYESLADAKASAHNKGTAGWRLAGYFIDVNGHDTDPVALLQHNTSLDCAVVFTGTNSFSEIFTSTTNYGAKYCGFSQVHVGYRNELWSLTGKYWQTYIKPRLGSCAHVMCIGHSLGGALCELFAACANSGHVGDVDYDRLAWEVARPRRACPPNRRKANDPETQLRNHYCIVRGQGAAVVAGGLCGHCAHGHTP